MTKLDLMKLKHYRAKIGEMTSQEALEIALLSELTCKDIGPFDPAFTMFKQRELDFTAYAELLEKEESEHAT